MTRGVEKGVENMGVKGVEQYKRERERERGKERERCTKEKRDRERDRVEPRDGGRHRKRQYVDSSPFFLSLS